MRPFLISLVLTALLASGGAFGKSRPNRPDSLRTFDYQAALRASQAAIGRRISDYPLTSAAGRRVSLAEFRGKPLVLSLVFTSCHTVCPTTTRHLAEVVDKARETLGRESFAVALLGFDSRFDTPQRMSQFARKQGIENRGWHLLSADADTIAALTRELGFFFNPSANGFDHLVQATVIDGEGQVYRQVYGEVFETPLLVSPLMELVLGRPRADRSPVDDLINRVRLFCTTYDPATDSYHFDYSLFIGMFIGGVIVFLIAGFLVREYRHGRRRQPSW